MPPPAVFVYPVSLTSAVSDGLSLRICITESAIRSLTSAVPGIHLIMQTADGEDVVRRVFTAAFLGTVFALFALVVHALDEAHFPNIPGPCGFWTGSGHIVELQDKLMDREIGLFILKIITDSGPSAVVCSAAVFIFLTVVPHNAVIKHICWNLGRLTRRVFGRYLIAACVGNLVFLTAAFMTHDGCWFLFLSWVESSSSWLQFGSCGIVCLLMYEQLRRMERNKYLTESLAHIVHLFLLSVILTVLWPDLWQPISESTYLTMGIAQLDMLRTFGALPFCGTSCKLPEIPLSFDCLLFIFLSALSGLSGWHVVRVLALTLKRAVLNRALPFASRARCCACITLVAMVGVTNLSIFQAMALCWMEIKACTHTEKVQTLELLPTATEIAYKRKHGFNNLSEHLGPHASAPSKVFRYAEIKSELVELRDQSDTILQQYVTGQRDDSPTKCGGTQLQY